MTEVFISFSNQANGDIQDSESEARILPASSAGPEAPWDSISTGFGERHMEGTFSTFETNASSSSLITSGSVGKLISLSPLAL